jgi:hypothetical protein
VREESAVIHAAECQCSHLAWNADTRNTKALRFYNKLGAKITEQKGDRCFLEWIPQAIA